MPHRGIEHLAAVLIFPKPGYGFIEPLAFYGAPEQNLRVIIQRIAHFIHVSYRMPVRFLDSLQNGMTGLRRNHRNVGSWFYRAITFIGTAQDVGHEIPPIRITRRNGVASY